MTKATIKYGKKKLQPGKKKRKNYNKRIEEKEEEDDEVKRYHYYISEIEIEITSVQQQIICEWVF